jgi:hypothetical protein
MIKKDPERRLYWIDDEGKRRLISDSDADQKVASSVLAQGRIIGVSTERLGEIAEGKPLPQITKDSFFYIEGPPGQKHFFMAIEDTVFWCSSLTPVFMYVDSLDDVQRKEPKDLREYKVGR